MIVVGSNEPNIKVTMSEMQPDSCRFMHTTRHSEDGSTLRPSLDTQVPFTMYAGLQTWEGRNCDRPGSFDRTYQLIASASKDGTVRIWRLQVSPEKQKLEIKEDACFREHEAEVWRVEWNVVGTVLASSGDDGTLRLFKMNFNSEWKCLSVVRGSNNE